MEETGASIGGCPIEPQFKELYAVLGNREAQDQIRDKHPEVAHCPKLRQEPNACTGCANNPHERPERRAEQERLQSYGPLVNRAFRLHTLAELGLLDRDALTSTDIEMLQTVHSEILATRMKAQALFIAERVAQLFAGSK